MRGLGLFGRCAVLFARLWTTGGVVGWVIAVIVLVGLVTAGLGWWNSRRGRD